MLERKSRRFVVLAGKFLSPFMTFLMMSSLSAQESIAGAIERRDIEAVRKILADGLAPDALVITSSDPEGKTPLMRASEVLNLEAMTALIQAGAKLDLSTKNNETALTLAFGGDSLFSDDKATNTDAVKLLIKVGANINWCNPKGQSVLMLALDSWRDTQGVVEALLVETPDIQVQDKKGMDALHYAVRDKKRNIHIARLLELGADPETIDHKGISLLMRAAGNYQLDLVRDFIARDLSVTHKSQSGKTAVHFAAEAGEGESDLSIGKKIKSILQLLHKHGASLTATDNDGDTPLHFAAMAGDPAVISYLLPYYPDVEIKNASDETPLHFAAGYGQAKAATLLLPGINNIEQRAIAGGTALTYATGVEFTERPGHRETALVLLEAGAEIDAKDENGKTPLHAAVAANHIDQMRFLLENGADPKVIDHPNSRLLRAARLYHDEITPPEDYAFLIEVLAGLATDIELRDAEDRTALMWVAASRNEAALEALLDRDPKLDVRSKDGRTALMWAACSDATESMKMLRDAGADDSLRDPTGRSASDWLVWINSTPQSKPPEGAISIGDRIIQSRQIALQKYLQEGIWKKEDRIAGIPPLHLAAALGDTTAIKTLLQLGAPRDSAMIDGSTPLMEAATNGQLKAVELFLSQVDDTVWADPSGELARAMDRSITFGHAEVARLFLQLEIKFSDDESNLLTALVHLGDEALLWDFLKAGATIGTPKLKEKNVPDPFAAERRSNPASVIIAAGRRTDSKMLRVLMEFPKSSGADKPNFLISALHHAAYRGRLENVKVFIEELKNDPDELLADSFGGVTVICSADFNDEGPQPIEEFSALSRALEEGVSEIVRYLVEQGATITGRTRSGTPPLTYVIGNRQDEMLRFFLKNEAPKELVDFDSQTALHCAAASNHDLAVRLLLEKGADPKAKTPDGLIPLDLARKNKAKEAISLLEATSE